HAAPRDGRGQRRRGPVRRHLDASRTGAGIGGRPHPLRADARVLRPGRRRRARAVELRDDRRKQVERVQLQLCPEADGPADPGARASTRCAARFGTELKLDTLNLLSPVIAEFHSARATTPAGPEDARVRTEWVWPSTDPGSGPGRIEVPSDGTPASLTATVTGRGVLSPRLSLPAGSYEIEARASGYRPAKITREVLPGITTVLVFALEAEAPVGGLSPAIRGRVAARVA